MRKILVIRGGALGDFVLTLPVLAALRGHFRRCSMEILGSPRFASLAVASGLAERAAPLDSPSLAPFFAPAPSGESSEASAKEDAYVYFSEFDLIISYLYDPERVFQSNVSRCSSAKFIAGPHRPDESLNMHATEQLLRPLESLGISSPDPRPRLMLALPGSDRVHGKWLALHPGSGSEQKNWPEANWNELLQSLAKSTKWNFLLVGGEAEGARCHRLSAALARKRITIAHDLPLVELAQKMKSCAGFLGHDSGITHLAAALDLPGLALWGPSDETTWRPRSDKINLLRHEAGLTNLQVRTVLDALRRRLPI